MRKLIVFAIAALICVSGIAAMGGSEAPAAPAEDQTDVLKIFLPQSPGVPEGVAAIAEAYMEDHPGKTIEIRTVPFGQYKQQLTIMWSSDEVDDIVMFAPCEVPSHVYNGCLLPLDDVFPPEEQAKYIPAVIESATVDGHIYSYPFRESCSAMYYNKEFFEMAGIEIRLRKRQARMSGDSLSLRIQARAISGPPRSSGRQERVAQTRSRQSPMMG